MLKPTSVATDVHAVRRPVDPDGRDGTRRAAASLIKGVPEGVVRSTAGIAAPRLTRSYVPFLYVRGPAEALGNVGMRVLPERRMAGRPRTGRIYIPELLDDVLDGRATPARVDA